MFWRNHSKREEQITGESAHAPEAENDADGVLIRIHEKEEEIAKRLEATRIEAEHIVTAAEQRVRKIKTEAVLEAERLAAERTAEILQESEAAIVRNDAASAAQRVEQARAREDRIDEGARYLVERITAI